jgi:XRE family transcriptional regulator, regulator of sulfur utilization
MVLVETGIIAGPRPARKKERALMKRIVLVGLALCAAGASRSDEVAILRSTVVPWAQIQAREATNGGRSRAIVRSPTATLDELESHLTTLAPGEDSHPPHRHPQEEMVILKEGVLEARLQGRVERVEAGGVVFLASQEERSVRNVGQTPATYYVIQWKVKAAR